MTTQNKKRGLGRGLDAILQSPETDITSADISGNYVAGAIAQIEIDKIETIRSSQELISTKTHSANCLNRLKIKELYSL